MPAAAGKLMTATHSPDRACRAAVDDTVLAWSWRRSSAAQGRDMACTSTPSPNGHPGVPAIPRPARPHAIDNAYAPKPLR